MWRARDGFPGLARALACGWVLLAMPVADAHDLWLEPASHSVRPGQRVDVTVRIGVDLQGDPISLAGAELRALHLLDDAGRQPVQVLEGREPALRLRPRRSGTSVLVYWSLPIPITLPASKFNPYLTDEGLEGVAALRAQLGQAEADAREAYVRCAKALIAVGEPQTLQDRAVGLPLELLASEGLDRSRDEQVIELRFQGRPLAGALVVALNERQPSQALRARTDAQGRVRLALQGDGRWLIKAVHMARALRSREADWNSWWASLSFAWPQPQR